MTDATTVDTPVQTAPSALSNLTTFLNGNKTYVALAIAGVAIALNHFGLWPNNIFPLQLDPNNWISDEWTMVIAAAFRSGMKKVGTGA